LAVGLKTVAPLPFESWHRREKRWMQQEEADERLLKISMNVRPLRTFEKPVQFMTPEQEGTEPPPSPRK